VLSTAETREADLTRKSTAATTSRAATVAQCANVISSRQSSATAGGYFLCPKVGCCREFSTEHLCNQHVVQGTCKLSGNKHSSSSHGVEPNDDNTLNLDELICKIMREELGINPTVVNRVAAPAAGGLQSLLAAAGGLLSSAATIFMFGWSVRRQLKHPPLDQEFIKFILWAWRYGEVDGHCKISAFTLCNLAALHGTVEGANKFPNDSYWAVTGEGKRTFSWFDIVEVWRVKQHYATMSTKSKAQQKPLGTRRVLSAEERQQLIRTALFQATTDTASCLNGLNAEWIMNRFIMHQVGDSTNANNSHMNQRLLQSIVGDDFKLDRPQKNAIVSLLAAVPKVVEAAAALDVAAPVVAVQNNAFALDIDGDEINDDEMEEGQLDEYNYENVVERDERDSDDEDDGEEVVEFVS
jgi:hypothetical protein